MLVFPPHWQPLMPHLALPSLTAYLRNHGVEVEPWDLNIDTFDQILSKRHMDGILHRLRRARRLIDEEDVDSRLEQARFRMMEWALQNGPRIARRIDWAKDVIRSQRFFEPEVSFEALSTITEGLRLASAPYYPSTLHLMGYNSAYPQDSTRAILTAVQDSDYNMFRPLFRRTVLPRIQQSAPDVVGISITSAHQVIAAFTLASLIKETGVNTHVTLGGKMITCWRELLPERKPLWNLFDSAIVLQGEQNLLQLIETLEQDGDLSSVPNLLYREGRSIRVNDPAPPRPAKSLPAPDFEGLPLERYLSPTPVIPLLASRGCYWGRCAFCNVGYGESKQFSENRPEEIAAEMMSLSETYDTPYIFFSDEALSPRMLKTLSQELIEANAELNWACCARFEPGITGEVLSRMRKAGCRMILYGLESGSQRVLDRMSKGTRLEVARRILEEGAEAGIWNHVFVFFGFPGETEEDAEETIQFFRDNRDVIHSGSSSTFLLERHAQVAQSPADYGVTRLIQHPEQDLAYYYDYQVSSGVTPEQAKEFEERFIDSLPDKPFPQFYFHDVYRFLYACHLPESEPFPTLLDKTP